MAPPAAAPMPPAAPAPAQVQAPAPAQAPWDPAQAPWDQAQAAAPWQQPAPAQRPPRAVPTVNPFVNTPISDYVKDVAAAACLLIAIALPWDFSGDANDRWWVVVALLIALVGLGVPYVMASRLLPAFAPAHSLAVKVGLALPLVISTLIAIVMDLLTIGDSEALYTGYGDGGIGIGIAIGLAGAGLMVQPRFVEEQTGHLAEGAWRVAGIAAAVGAVVLGVVAFVAYVINLAVSDSFGFLDVSFWLVIIAFALVIPFVGAGLPTAFLLRGTAGGRRVLAAVAWTVIVVTFLGSNDADVFGSTGVESWFGPTGGTFLMGLAAALLVSRPSVRRTARPAVHPVSGWLETARLALITSAALLAVSAIALLVVMIALEEFPGLVITLVLTSLGAGVASGVAAGLLADLRQRTVATVAISVVIVLGIVSWIILATADDLVFGAGTGLGVWDAVMFFALPGLALWALWVPAPVRAALPPRPQQSTWSQEPAGWMTPPAQPQQWVPPTQDAPAAQPPVWGAPPTQ